MDQVREAGRELGKVLAKVIKETVKEAVAAGIVEAFDETKKALEEEMSLKPPPKE